MENKTEIYATKEDIYKLESKIHESKNDSLQKNYEWREKIEAIFVG